MYLIVEITLLQHPRIPPRQCQSQMYQKTAIDTFKSQIQHG